jgi:hypothetical protein
MSLGIVIKGPEGLVLAAESRVTLTARQANQPEMLVNFDNATKLLSFNFPYSKIGVVTYGQAAIGLRSAHSFIPEFEAELKSKPLSVLEFSEKLSDFFIKQWNAVMPKDFKGPGMVFVTTGFNEEEPYGRVYLSEIPRNPKPVEQNPNPGEFGLTWGGQGEFVNRLIMGFANTLPTIISKALKLNQTQIETMNEVIKPLQMQIPLQAMPLQDCIDLAIFFIRTTIDAQRLTVAVRGCGGPIDIAVITRGKDLIFVQRKKVVGEKGE